MSIRNFSQSPWSSERNSPWFFWLQQSWNVRHIFWFLSLVTFPHSKSFISYFQAWLLFWARGSSCKRMMTKNCLNIFFSGWLTTLSLPHYVMCCFLFLQLIQVHKCSLIHGLYWIMVVFPILLERHLKIQGNLDGLIKNRFDSYISSICKFRITQNRLSVSDLMQSQEIKLWISASRSSKPSLPFIFIWILYDALTDNHSPHPASAHIAYPKLISSSNALEYTDHWTEEAIEIWR